MTNHISERNKLRERLIADGWRESRERFWLEEPCFYDLTTTKTVLLFPVIDDVDAALYYWKYDWCEVPEYLDPTSVEVRRYKLHHSMNALLWHDYQDRKIVH